MKAGNARNRPLVIAMGALLLAVSVSACDGGPTAEDYKARALELQAEGDLAGSLIEFANALQAAPDDAELRYLAGKAHLEAGNTAAAVRELSRAVEIGTEHEDAAELLATARRQAALQIDMPGGDVLELRRQIRDNPDDLEPRHELVRTYLEVGSGRAAERELQTLLDAQANNLAYRADMARALLLQDEYDRVLEEYPAGLGVTREERAEFLVLRGRAFRGKDDVDAARAAYAEALDLVPSYAPALLALAALEMRAGQFDAAAELIDLAAEGTAYEEAEGLEAKANLALFRDDNATAEELYARALEMKPHRLVLQRNLAHAQLNQKKYQAATQTVVPLLKATPNDALTNYIRAATAYHLEDYETAVEYADRTTSLSNDYAHAYFLAGVANYRMQNIEQALDALEKYVARVPRHEAARIYLANTLVKLEEFSRAHDILQPLAASRADDAEFLEFVGQVARQAGDLQEADVVLTRATALQPENAQLRTQLANVKIALGEREAGVGELQKAIEIDPDQSDLVVDVILEHIRSSNFDEALAEARRYQETHPEKPQGYLLAGIAHAGKNETADAWRSFEKVLELVPGHPGASAGLAEIATKEGRLDAARGFLKTSLEHYPEHPTAYLNLARLEEAAGRPEAAIERLESGLDVNPENMQLRINLAEAYRKVRRPLAALEALEPVREDNPDALAVQGAAELLAGRLDEAVRTLTERVRLQPENAVAHVQLAEAALHAGDLAVADEHARKAVELAPDSPVAQIAETRVDIASITVPEDAEAVAEKLRQLHEQYPRAATVVELQGSFLDRLNRHERAVPLLEAVNEHLDNTFTTVRLANAQWQADRSEDAIATLTDWLDRYPHDQYARLALARIAYRTDRFDLASRHMLEILERDPTLSNLHAPLAAALMRADRLDEAAEYARLAYAEEPYNPAATEVLAAVYLDQGTPERAVSILRPVAAEFSQGQESLRLRYAQALSAAGDVEAARTVLQNLLADDAEFEGRPQAEALLESLPAPQ